MDTTIDVMNINIGLLMIRPSDVGDRQIEKGAQMHRTVRTAVTAVAMTVVVIAGMAGLASAAIGNGESSMVPNQYRVIDLGDLGGMFGDATALNDRGDVVGWSTTAAEAAVHPFLWRNQTMTDLGVLDSTVVDYGVAADVNDRGEVVGWSSAAGGTQHAVLWRDGTVIDLGTLGGQYSIAYAINNRSEIVGLADLANGESHGFRWVDGVMTDLGLVTAVGINDRGQATGSIPTSDGQRAYRWWQGAFTYAPGNSEAVAINQAGWVTGQNASGVFLWRNDVLQVLPNPGGDGARASAINDQGLVLGVSWSFSYGTRDVIWQGDMMIDLSEHGIAPTGVLLGAGGLRDINNTAQIAGDYYYTEGVQSPALYTR